VDLSFDKAKQEQMHEYLPKSSESCQRQGEIAGAEGWLLLILDADE
jgi:hypothetical protein